MGPAVIWSRNIMQSVLSFQHIRATEEEDESLLLAKIPLRNKGLDYCGTTWTGLRYNYTINFTIAYSNQQE